MEYSASGRSAAEGNLRRRRANRSECDGVDVSGGVDERIPVNSDRSSRLPPVEDGFTSNGKYCVRS